MPINNSIFKRIKGRDRVWSFVRKDETLRQPLHELEQIEVLDLEIDDEDVLDWFMRHTFSNPNLPNLKRAVLIMDGLEVTYFILSPLLCLY